MVTLYVTSYCPYCRSAERLLDRLGVKYEKHDITNDAETRQRIVAETGWRTVPVILIDGRLVGGYDDLKRLHDSGELAGLLQASMQTP